MKDISNIIKNNYYMNNTKLEHDFNEALKNKQFNKLISNLDFSHKYLMKYTTKLEECTKEKLGSRNAFLHKRPGYKQESIQQMVQSYAC